MQIIAGRVMSDEAAQAYQQTVDERVKARRAINKQFAAMAKAAGAKWWIKRAGKFAASIRFLYITNPEAFRDAAKALDLTIAEDRNCLGVTIHLTIKHK
jgi:hypothetical protein